MWLYTFSIRCYFFIIRCISPFHHKAAKFVKGRKQSKLKLEDYRKSFSGKVVWIHCASLGEFEQGRPVIEGIKERFPHERIVLSFFSPSGYEIRNNYDKVDLVVYLPIDTIQSMNNFISILNPSLAVFVKYEFWLNCLNQLKNKNIPVILVSALFRADQHFFKWYGRLFFRSLKTYRHIYVQNTASLELLKRHGIHTASLAGDTRFDRVWKIRKDAVKIPALEVFAEEHIVIIAGSTWPKDEHFLIEVLKRLDEKVRLVIAPHEVDEASIMRLEKLLTDSRVSYFKFSHTTYLNEAKVLILDNMGWLSSAYRYGNIAYIGGGFGNGIHNILEAITYGMPVIFGPNYNKFHEANECILNGTAFSFSSESELENHLKKLIRIDQLETIRSKAEKYIQLNLGVTERILNHLEEDKLLISS